MQNPKHKTTAAGARNGRRMSAVPRKAHGSRDAFDRFASCERGAVAILFAFMIVIMVVIIGGAVDYGRWLNARTKQQSAVDAAVLAAGRAFQVSHGSVSEAVNAASRYYLRMKSGVLQGDTTSFDVVENGKAVLATSEAAVATPFLAFAGIPELPVRISSKAIMSAGGNADASVELALMLDITGSMSGSKIEDLRLAAKDLIDIVVWQDQSRHHARIAVAPFSEHVNVGPAYFEAVTGRAPETTGTRKTCVRERDTSDRYTDAAPAYGNYFVPSYGWGDCRPQSTIMPLSNDKQALKAHIDSLTTEGYTAGHLGVAWTWYMLSPRWAQVWTGQAAPSNHNTKTRKIAVLMTDGEFNRAYAGANSATQARALCSGMKADGVTIYTIGFQIADGGEAHQTMAQCASDPSHFFNSETGEELRQAFREIALQVVTLRLSR